MINTELIHSRLTEIAGKIGNTPLVPVKGLHKNPKVKIYAKAEWRQLSGSVKARAAYSIFKEAVETGKLSKDRILLDASSGNTGIAYAAIGQALEIPVTICLPENASAERKELLAGYGANLIYTFGFGGTDEAQQVAKELYLNNPRRYYYANQYSNENNWKAHYKGTAEEIITQRPDITHFVTGLGTTGTFVGTSRKLKEYNRDIMTIGLQPDLTLHGLEGWKHLETAIVPGIYDDSLADRILEVRTEDAYDIIKAVYYTEQWLLSPSSAANISGAIQLSEMIDEGVIVTILPDNSDKYSDLINKIF